MYMNVVLCIGGMICLAFWAPKGWDILGFTATAPVAVMLISHLILPVCLYVLGFYFGDANVV